MISPEDLEIIQTVLIESEHTPAIEKLIKKIDLLLEMNKFNEETSAKRAEYNQRVAELQDTTTDDVSDEVLEN